MKLDLAPDLGRFRQGSNLMKENTYPFTEPTVIVSQFQLRL